MARYLVVAHQTVTSPELLKVVRGVRDQDADAEFVLLVPATPAVTCCSARATSTTPRPPRASAANGAERCSPRRACR